MLFKSLVAISIFAASAFAYDPIIRPVPRDVDVMKMAIPGNAKNFPGKKKDLNVMFPGQIHRWEYPPTSDLQPWPQQPEGSKRDECSLTIRVNVGSCKSGAYGYKPQIIPYDAPSTKAIEGKVKFQVDHENNQYYDYTEVTVDCYWRGRIMPTDSPEFQQRIGLLGVRVDTSPTGMQAWVTEDPDPELHYNATQIAPIGFLEFGGHKPYNVDWKSDRGYEKSKVTSDKKNETLYIQVC